LRRWSPEPAPHHPETRKEPFEYSSGDANYRFCDGTNWLPVSNNGTVSTCSGLGTMDYDTTNNILKWCNNTNWIDMSQVTSISNLVARYKLDSSSGTTATDSAGTNNGTLTNMTVPAAWVSGKIYNGLQMDGVDDHVIVADNAALNFGTGSFSYGLWFKTTDSTNNNSLIMKKQNGASTSAGYSLRGRPSDGTGQFSAHLSDGTTQKSVFVAITSVTDGNWHHVMIVVDHTANFLYMYIDGSVATSTGISTVGSTTNVRNLDFGNDASNYFNGTMDDIRIYNKALSAAEVTALYNSGRGCL